MAMRTKCKSKLNLWRYGMMKKVMMLMMAVAVVAAAQAVTVSWDGTSDDITGLTANIQDNSWVAADLVWSTSTLLIDSPG
ncbi:MAG: hypothetical protein ACYTEN_00485, partial [Planctomycetota bacterium]